MTLLVPAGPLVVPEPELPTPFPRPLDPGQLRATWIAPDGTVWPLTSPGVGWHTLDAVTGALGDAPQRINTRPHPRGGVQVTHIQPQARYITWPMRVEGLMHMDLVTRWRQLAAAFKMTSRLGPGILQIARPDGTAREIEAMYQDGFKGEQGQGHTYDTAVLTLMCEDPYWRDIFDQEPVTREFVDASVDYQDPYPSVSSSQSVDGATTIDNPGEIEAFPIWTITGPMTSLVAQNLTTGKAFTLTATLADNTQVATINTYDGTVVDPDGDSWFGLLNQPGADLWGLAPGTNDIEFTMAGADTGSKIVMTWRNRWETA